MTAHLLTGSPVPLALQWLVAVLLFGGVLGAVTLRSRSWRVVATGIACCGFGGTVATWVVAVVQPGAPPYALRVAAPPNGTHSASPVLLTVCGVRPDGSLLPATDPQHYLVVFADGHEIPTVDDWQFTEALAPGRHTIRVELVTPAHHAFNPPAVASVTLTVAPDAPSAGPHPCR